MDWIERIFGISPDGGSGATELLIGICLAVGLTVAMLSLNAFGLRARLKRRIMKRPSK
jgi:hypothetical protein